MEQTVSTEYQVKTPVFEGPLEVLLSLIEKRKLFINEISLAQVTEDYIQHVRNLSSVAMNEMTSFIVISATLILIKSKSLLPNISLTDEEETQIVNLEDRLKLYQFVKNISLLVKEKFGTKIIFERGERDWSEPIFSPDEQITVSRMNQAIRDVFAQIPKKEFVPEVSVKKVISIEEMIDSLTERVSTSMRMSFRDFSQAKDAQTVKEQKVYLIVGFLAMLELVRQGIVDVIQSDSFSDIEMMPHTEELEINLPQS